MSIDLIHVTASPTMTTLAQGHGKPLALILVSMTIALLITWFLLAMMTPIIRQIASSGILLLISPQEIDGPLI
jgi:hypothetical protein